MQAQLAARGMRMASIVSARRLNIPRTFSLKQSNLHWISFLWCNKLEVTFCTYYMQLFSKVKNNKFILSTVNLYWAVITAPLSTKRSWRVASEEFDSVYKNCCSFVYFNSSPRWGAPLYYKKEERCFLFACICIKINRGWVIFSLNLYAINNYYSYLINTLRPFTM